MEIGAVTLIVKDMEKMAIFYRDVMNMVIEWDGGIEIVADIPQE
ncbi:VOC family protein [Paenibacillus sp. FSL E2-8871]